MVSDMIDKGGFPLVSDIRDGVEGFLVIAGMIDRVNAEIIPGPS